MQEAIGYLVLRFYDVSAVMATIGELQICKYISAMQIALIIPVCNILPVDKVLPKGFQVVLTKAFQIAFEDFPSR